MNILAIESSCDDTSCAVLSKGKILANLIANQAIHEAYGGVVPELASRAHAQHIIPVVQQALEKAGITKNDLDAIAFTKGPGLIGSLMVGSSFAKGFAQGLGIPLIGVNHMQAHVLAHFIDDPVPDFPFLCLTVSGGHTQIVLVKDHLDMEVIGTTKDDAAGEAFDKSAKLMGLPYPGGPLIDKYGRAGDAARFTFPIPKVEGLDFSFSGLKTSIRYFLERETAQNPNFIEENRDDICAGIQSTIVSILINKLEKAALDLGIQSISIAGGVSANSLLREELQKLGQRRNWNTFIPKFEYCTDNAAMIAMAASFLFQKEAFDDLNVKPEARLLF